MALDVMSLTAKLSLDTSEYEAALRAAVNQGREFASNIGSVSSGFASAQSAANVSGTAFTDAAQSAQSFGQNAREAAANATVLGEEIGETTQQTEDYERQTDSSEDSTRRFGSEMRKASVIGNLMASAIRKAATEIVQFGKESIAAGMNFDSSMSQVAATMGKTTAEVQDLREYAQKMGAETVFSATQAADA